MPQNKSLAATKVQPLVRLISYESDSNRRSVLRRVLLASSLAFCVGAAALGMVQPSGESLVPPEQQLVQQIVPIRLSADFFNTGNTQEQTAAPFIHETRVRAGDSLATVLKRLDIADGALLSFMARDPNARSIYKLYPGRSVQSATNEQGQLLWIRYFHSPNIESNGQSIARLLQISTTDNGFKAQEIDQLTEIHTEVAVGTIERSLFATTDAAGIPDGITTQMAEVLGSKVDFLRGLKRGDQFRVVYETRTNEGRTVGNGRVLALEFINNGRPYSAIWYSPDGKSGSYYDTNGDSLQGAFLRNAIKFSRISSTFGLRTIAGNQAWSGHHPGIDYAAPTGTPIHATADGTIDQIGWKNGYGNTIVIKHHGKITTLYAHQSRFAEGLSVGSRVSQGQLIGYVGSTGWSTGAHLHYEFRVADKPIDPLTAVTMPQSMPLSTEQREAFSLAVAPFKQQLQVLAKFQEAVSESSSIASR